VPAEPPSHSVERFGVFDLLLRGPGKGNPLVDTALSAELSFNNRILRADGFYGGDGLYRVRCMPDAVGTWRYVTRSACRELNGVEGAFACVPAAPSNHGPVSVAHTYHFAYADGTPYFQVGAACYAWTRQSDALEEQQNLSSLVI
jgi:hypothetical protein